MTTVFVYEDVTATGAGGDGQTPPASLLAEGRAMLAAVVADFSALPGVQVLAPWAHDEAGVATIAEFRRHARAADYTLLIAPETGGRLERLAREVLSAGGRLLGPSPAAIRLTADKWALAQHWQTHGVATPPTWLAGDEPTDVPIVIKPRDGAGSAHIALRACGESAASSPRRGGGVGGKGLEPATPTLPPTPLPEAGRGRKISGASAAAATADKIAQQYIPGFHASVSFLIGESSIRPLIPSEQLLSTDGRFQYLGGRLPIEPTLAGRAIQIATSAVHSVPGLRGYVGVDVVLGNDGRAWAIEVNPRLTTSYVGLRALAKLNLAQAIWAIVSGSALPTFEWRQSSLRFTSDGRVMREPA